MDRIALALAVLAALGAAPGARAQAAAAAPPAAAPGAPAAPAAPAAAPAVAPAIPAGWWAVPRIGLGLGIDALSLGSFIQDTVAGIPAAPVSIYVPLQVVPWFRIDPSFGAGTYRQDATSSTSPYSGFVWTIGVGLLGFIVPPEPFGVYVGARVGVAFSGDNARTPSGALEQVRETDWSLLAAFGAEYFFVRQFALGAELRLGGYFFGNPRTTTNGVTTTVDRNRTGFATSGVFFLRYFFY
jgi:hypothetical protein